MRTGRASGCKPPGTSTTGRTIHAAMSVPGGCVPAPASVPAIRRSRRTRLRYDSHRDASSNCRKGVRGSVIELVPANRPGFHGLRASQWELGNGHTNLTIEMPDDLARSLEGIAAARHKSVQQLALEQLSSLISALHAGTPEAVLRAIHTSHRTQARRMLKNSMPPYWPGACPCVPEICFRPIPCDLSSRYQCRQRPYARRRADGNMALFDRTRRIAWPSVRSPEAKSCSAWRGSFPDGGEANSRKKPRDYSPYCCASQSLPPLPIDMRMSKRPNSAAAFHWMRTTCGSLRPPSS